MARTKPGEGFSGGVAVITGAGSGLGAAMARRFAEVGMSVCALDIDGEGAENTALSIRDMGVEAFSLALDVADREALFVAAGQVQDRMGYCSVLCANVGVQQFGAIGTLTENDWRWVLDVNVMGVVHSVDAFLPLLRKAPTRRHVVITSSSAAYSPGIRMGAYTTSKYAVTGYAETLRLELAEEDIGVSILFPAGMATRHLESSVKARPERFGPSELRRSDIDAMMQSRKIDRGSHVATADHATRHLIEDICDNRRYIITHGDCREAIVDNFEALLAAQDRALQ
ncbi:MAG TPA: SDR family NAD(P)-dependent oxidoreductase [Porticoccaceae bacterium]